MDETLLQQILHINSPDDVMECYHSLLSHGRPPCDHCGLLISKCVNFKFPYPTPEEFISNRQLLTAQCMNFSLPIPPELLETGKIFLERCLDNDDLEYFKLFISIGCEKDLGNLNLRRDYFQNCPNILNYCLENNIAINTYKLEISNPACVEILKKFNVPYRNIKDTKNVWRGKMPDLPIPHRKKKNYSIVKYRDLIEFMLVADIDNMEVSSAIKLGRLFDYYKVYFFLREDEYEIIFNKLTKIWALSGQTKPDLSRLCDFFRLGMDFLTPSQEDFLIREHLDFLKLEAKRVIYSGKRRLVEAIREEK